MKVCSQCASLTNKPVRINEEIVCQECATKLRPTKEKKMKYEIKNPIIIEDKEKKKIRTMIKIGEIDFAFMSNEVDSHSMEKYFNFSCNDPLLSGACKVLGLEEEKVKRL